MEIKKQLSDDAQPSVEDRAIVAGEIDRFNDASDQEKERLFEKELVPLAREVADRSDKSDDWRELLMMISHATSKMAAEDVSDIFRSTMGVSDTQFTEFSLPRDPVPAVIEEDIYKQVNTDGCLLRAVANRYVTLSHKCPIFYGKVLALDTDGGVIGEFEFDTGGYGQSFKREKGPLPPGRYAADNLRSRDEIAMRVDGIGYSIDLFREVGTQVYGRGALRIHPDGNALGTLGCLGIRGNKAEQQRARDAFARVISGSNGKALLSMRYEK